MASPISPYWFAAHFDKKAGSRFDRAGTQSSQQKPKVVVVDDEHLIADTIAEILETAGYEAKPFYDAESALEYCQESSPDIVISDYVMPGLNGLELAQKLRKECPGARVLLLTGQGNVADIADSMRKAGEDFEILAKPLHPEELFERLRHRKS